MRVAVAADHAGRSLLERVLEAVRTAGHEPLVLDPDGGAHDDDDYPDVARAVTAAVLDGRAERAIAVCGSGAGVAVAACKVRGIRASLAHDTYTARQMVEHDDVNVLALGARVIGPELAADVVAAFLGATFSGAPRYRRRLAKLVTLESDGRP